VNALLPAETMVGRDGHPAPHCHMTGWREVMARYGT
jgi:hypothetical protein